jgi:hypothetical protein
MKELKDFGNTAQSLSKNPLGIIALFIVLIYGFAALVVGFSSNLNTNERLPIIWFLVIFPIIVILVFAWLVSCHYEKLYGPKDYGNAKLFLETLQKRRKDGSDLNNLEKIIEEKTKLIMNSNEFMNTKSESKSTVVAEKFKKEIRKAYFTIDAREFTNSNENIFDLPIWNFKYLSDLIDEIYFLLIDYVNIYQYGYSWVIQDISTNEIIKNKRILNGMKAGTPAKDYRSLSDVGILGNKIYKVIKPNNL